MRYERRVEHRTSAIGELTPETPSVPKTEIAVRGIRGLRSEQLHQNAPLFSLAGRCVDIGLELLLAAVGGVGDVSHARVGREARSRRSTAAAIGETTTQSRLEESSRCGAAVSPPFKAPSPSPMPASALAK
jgi:hypothetical protein